MKTNKRLLERICYLLVTLSVLSVICARNVSANCYDESTYDVCVPAYTCICGEDFYNPGQYSCLWDEPASHSCPPGELPSRMHLLTCDSCDSCSCGGGCFAGDTPVSTPDGESAISDLKEGDMVSSYDPQTGSESTSLIQKTFEYSRGAYYKIRTKDGEELKVTAEHPLYAIQKEETPLSFWEYLKKESLTKKAIDYLFK